MLQVEKMKEIAKIKAKEEKRKLESEVRLKELTSLGEVCLTIQDLIYVYRFLCHFMQCVVHDSTISHVID